MRTFADVESRLSGDYDEHFIYQSRRHIMAHIEAMEKHGYRMSPVASVRFSDYIWRWLNQTSAKSEETKEKTREFVVAICDGLDSGKISLRTQEDMFLFCEIPFIQLGKYPKVIRRYVNSGELLELMSVVLKTTERLSSVDRDKATARTIRDFYKHEMFTVKQMVARGEDTEDWTGLPVEVRVEFSGVMEKD